MNIDQLTGKQLRHLRRDWDDLGGGKAVDRGPLAPFHKYIETVTCFSDGTPITVDESGMIVFSNINGLIAEEREYREAA